MQWRSWFRRNDTLDLDAHALDVELILADGLRDLPAARQAIGRLQQERKLLICQRKVVDAQFKRLTSVGLRNIARTGPNQLATFELSQAMRDQNTTSQASTYREAQITTIKALSQVIDQAILKLEDLVRS